MIINRRHIRLVFPALVVLAGIGIAAGARADGIRGLFCNTRADIGNAMALMAEGRSPVGAAALMNTDSVRCTYLDTIRYVMSPAVIVDGTGTGAVYRAQLTGVLVGDRVMAITPPAELFFVTPDAQLVALSHEV